MAVGSAVPHAEAGVGAVATQATTNVIHGGNCLRLLKMGFEPTKELMELYETYKGWIKERRKDPRQVRGF